MTCSGNVEARLSTGDRQSNVGVAGESFQFDLTTNTCRGDVSAEGDDIFKVVARQLESF